MREEGQILFALHNHILFFFPLSVCISVRCWLCECRAERYPALVIYPSVFRAVWWAHSQSDYARREPGGNWPQVYQHCLITECIVQICFLHQYCSQRSSSINAAVLSIVFVNLICSFLLLLTGWTSPLRGPQMLCPSARVQACIRWPGWSYLAGISSRSAQLLHSLRASLPARTCTLLHNKYYHLIQF